MMPRAVVAAPTATTAVLLDSCGTNHSKVNVQNLNFGTQIYQILASRHSQNNKETRWSLSKSSKTEKAAPSFSQAFSVTTVCVSARAEREPKQLTPSPSYWEKEGGGNRIDLVAWARFGEQRGSWELSLTPLMLLPPPIILHWFQSLVNLCYPFRLLVVNHSKKYAKYTTFSLSGNT